mgnify:CR=1 FL=1
MVPPSRPRLPNEPDACDLLAADPWDPGRVAEGVELDEIDGGLAVEACTRALEQLRLPRFAYQRARALLRLERFSEAERALDELHKAGHLPASFELARLRLVQYGDYERSYQDREKFQESAVQPLLQAVERGQPPAQVFLARIRSSGAYQKREEEKHYGIRWKTDVAEAARLAQAAATAGHREGAFLLGRFYEEGIGVPLVTREALRWYRVAAEKGHEEALRQYARYDPTGAEAVRSQAETARKANASRLARDRERALALLEEERPRIVLTTRWPDDVVAAIDELRWAIADKIRSDVETVAKAWADLVDPVEDPKSTELAQFWWSLAGAAFAEPDGAGRIAEVGSGVRLVRHLVGLYETEEERRQALELLLWGIGELRAPVAPPTWATPEAAGTGAATPAELVEDRFAQLVDRLHSAGSEAAQRAEEVVKLVERFRELVVRSTTDHVEPGADARTPPMGAVAAFTRIREAAAVAVGTNGPVRIASETTEGRPDGVPVAFVAQSYFADSEKLVGRIRTSVPLAPGSAPPAGRVEAIPTHDFAAASARAFPALLALELANLRWFTELVAVEVERAAGLPGARPWRPEPTARTAVLLPGRPAAESRPGSAAPQRAAGTAQPEPPAGSQGSPLAPATTPTADRALATEGTSSIASTTREGAAVASKVRLQLEDGSSVVATLLSGQVRFRSLFGEVELPFDDIANFRDGLLTLGDGTQVRGGFTAGSFRIRTTWGEVSIEATKVKGLERVSG